MTLGQIACNDVKTQVVVLAPRDELFEKTASNIQEVLARGGKVVMISDRQGLARFGGKLFHGIEVPPPRGSWCRAPNRARREPRRSQRRSSGSPRGAAGRRW